MGALLERIVSSTSWWTDLYGSSTPVEVAVMFLHLGGMVAAGGLAFTLDRAVLRSARGWPGREHLARELHLSHRAVLVGLAAVFLSGLALTASDPEIFLVSWVYWAKMLVVALLLTNGWFLKRSGERVLANPEDDGAFRGLRRAAVRSGGLWALTVLAGVALTLYA